MMTLTKLAVFARWVVQKEGSVDPKKFQHFAVLITLTGILSRKDGIVYLGLLYFLVNHLLLYYMEFNRRKVYENWVATRYRSQNPKSTEKLK